MPALVASARMYAVAPGAAAAWRALLAAVGARAGMALDVIDHAYPAPLAELWGRADLGCAFMCGWPLAREGGARPVIAAPVPAAAWSQGQALYRSDFVVAAESPLRSLEDSFGGRFAFNALSSHSGANLPRAHLAAWAARAPLYAGLVGPLTTPRRCIEAVVAGQAEITAVDSYALDLLRRHDPDLVGQIRVIGATQASPIPPLVGSAGLAERDRTALRGALLGLHADAAGRALLGALGLLRFGTAKRATYDSTLRVEAQALPLDRWAVA